MQEFIGYLDTEFSLSSECHSKRADIQSRIDALNSQLLDFKRESEAAKAVDSSEWTTEQDTVAEALRRRRPALLREALALHRECEAFMSVLSDEQRKARDNAESNKEQVENQIKRKLVAVGYLDFIEEAGPNQPGAYTPGMIANHPLVIAERMKVNSLLSNESFLSARRYHANESTKILEALEDLKRQSVAGV